MAIDMVCVFECERCGHSVQHSVQKKMLGYKAPPYPEGWDEIQAYKLCRNCVTAFNDIFDKFMREGRTKKYKK